MKPSFPPSAPTQLLHTRLYHPTQPWRPTQPPATAPSQALCLWGDATEWSGGKVLLLFQRFCLPAAPVSPPALWPQTELRSSHPRQSFTPTIKKKERNERKTSRDNDGRKEKSIRRAAPVREPSSEKRKGCKAPAPGRVCPRRAFRHPIAETRRRRRPPPGRGSTTLGWEAPRPVSAGAWVSWLGHASFPAGDWARAKPWRIQADGGLGCPHGESPERLV